MVCGGREVGEGCVASQFYFPVCVFCTNKFDEWKNRNVESVGSYVKEEEFARRGGSLYTTQTPLYVLQ